MYDSYKIYDPEIMAILCLMLNLRRDIEMTKTSKRSCHNMVKTTPLNEMKAAVKPVIPVHIYYCSTFKKDRT